LLVGLDSSLELVDDDVNVVVVVVVVVVDRRSASG